MRKKIVDKIFTKKGKNKTVSEVYITKLKKNTQIYYKSKS